MNTEGLALRLARYREPPIRVKHALLTKYSDQSDYRVKCPACSHGLLMVRRDQQTFALCRDDYCISCLQRFQYTDDEIAGEPIV